MLRPIEEMHRQDDLWVCTYDAGERVRTKLDRLNARERPFQIKPLPYPKPQNPYYPNTLETDDAAVFKFLATQVSAQCRYDLVASGEGVYTAAGQGIAGLSWAARYFYDLIQENDQSRLLLIPQAKTLLGAIADYLLTRQYGSQTGPSPGSTRATDAFFGGILAPGASTFVTDDVSTSGLALLYAYRVLGTISYRDGTRAAASYLRNVQANGSNGTNYTSTDSGGTGRLYTGSLASEVSTAAGFYTNSLFYPSALLALEFWNELKTTDGDQSIGATAAVAGFNTAPSQLLSQSIVSIRSFWDAGYTDVNGISNGFSSTTPREVLNAYPSTKTNFTTVIGTGQWEFVDGVASIGTEITAQNFARGLSALYNYEGATARVTTISDWLLTFTSNTKFETPSPISVPQLYKGTTGTYDPTTSLASVLTVRNAAVSYAGSKINGSSLYDWGAFGLMSRIWGSRNTASFRQSRLFPLNTVQRFYNGNWSDGLASDRIILRGRSGLTMQTAFAINVLQRSQGVAFTLSRNSRGSDLQFDQDGIAVPSGELARCNYWRFTSVDDNNGTIFPYVDGSYAVPVGEAIVFYNATLVDLQFTGMGMPGIGSLSFWLYSGATILLPPGYVIVFVRDDVVGAWKQVGSVQKAISATGLESPISVVNDAVYAAQFGRSIREAR